MRINILITLIAASILPCTAYAYLGGGSATMLIQLILGSTAGIAIIIRMCWVDIKLFFQKKIMRKNTKNENDEDNSSETTANQ